MNTEMPDEIISLGAFEPRDTKSIIRKLEAQAIDFEIGLDESLLRTPGRGVEFQLGRFPDGSKNLIFIHKDNLPEAEAILASVFPQ